MRIFLFFIFIVVSNICVGQMVIYTPNGNVTIPTYHYGPPMYNPYYTFERRHKSTYQDTRVKHKISSSYNFKIALDRSDSIFNQRSKIELSLDGNFLSFWKRREKIVLFPASTKSISVKKGSKIIKGIPADSCWLFKVESGRINSYSIVPEKMVFDIIAIQLGDGPIRPLTKATLKEFVGTDSDLHTLIDRGRFTTVIRRFNKKKE